MIAELKPYPEYKDSNLPWLGKIPKHWEEKRAKCYFREVDERSKTGNEELLSVSHITGVTPRSQKNITMFKAESYAGYKTCKPGDLAINTMWAWMGALGVSKYSGIISSGYAVYRPIRVVDYVPDFIDHLLRIPPYTSEFFCRSTGIRSSRFRLYPDKFLKIPIIYPPREEQEEIITFLNRENQKINRYIQAKNRLIEILNERKQVIVSNAVTRGIDPNVRCVPSGIDWLGDIPEHWEFIKMKYLFTERVQKGYPDQPLLAATQVKGVVPKNLYEHRTVTASKDLHLLKLVKEGDFVISLRSFQGGIEYAFFRGIISPAYTILEPTTTINTDYFRLLFKTHIFIENLSFFVTGIREGQNIDYQKLKQAFLPLPPKEEQKIIADYTLKNTEALDSAITKYYNEIRLVQEYQTRLITETITGKMDVRNVKLEINVNHKMC